MEEKVLQPKRDLREIIGYLDELLDPQFYETEKMDDYLKITLLDEGALIDPINKLRQVYPNVLHLERKIDVVDLQAKKVSESEKESQKSKLALSPAILRRNDDE